MVGAVLVNDDDEIMLITNACTLVRTRVNEVSVTGRNTQGVKLISLSEDEKLIGIECLADADDAALDTAAQDQESDLAPEAADDAEEL